MHCLKTKQHYTLPDYTAVQSQKAVSAYCTSKQILHFILQSRKGGLNISDLNLKPPFNVNMLIYLKDNIYFKFIYLILKM